MFTWGAPTGSQPDAQPALASATKPSACPPLRTRSLVPRTHRPMRSPAALQSSAHVLSLPPPPPPANFVRRVTHRLVQHTRSLKAEPRQSQCAQSKEPSAPSCPKTSQSKRVLHYYPRSAATKKTLEASPRECNPCLKPERHSTIQRSAPITSLTSPQAPNKKSGNCTSTAAAWECPVSQESGAAKDPGAGPPPVAHTSDIGGRVSTTRQLSGLM